MGRGRRETREKEERKEGRKERKKGQWRWLIRRGRESKPWAGRGRRWRKGRWTGKGRVSRDRARCNARAAVHKQRRASQSAPAKVTRVMSRCPLCRTNSATRPKAAARRAEQGRREPSARRGAAAEGSIGIAGRRERKSRLGWATATPHHPRVHRNGRVMQRPVGNNDERGRERESGRCASERFFVTLSTLSPSLFCTGPFQRSKKMENFTRFAITLFLFFLSRCLVLEATLEKEGGGWSICWREFRTSVCVRGHAKEAGKECRPLTTTTLNVFAQKKPVMQDRATDDSFVRSF